MKIASINNSTSFQKRIKISKPAPTTFALGASALATGLSSLYIGSDTLDIIPNSGLAADVYDNINDVHIVQTEKGQVEVNNEMEALLSAMTMASGLPAGSVLTPVGSNLLRNSFREENLNSDKKIPD